FLPAAALQAGGPRQAQGPGRRAAFRPSLDAAARYGAGAARRARRMGDRLGGRADGAAQRGCLPPRRLRGLRVRMDPAPEQPAEAHRRFYDEYNAVLDMPAEYYLDTVKTVFKDFALPKGRMFVRGELVRPQAIRETALLTIEGELDDISGHGQTESAHQLCLNIPAGRREHFKAPQVGHYGIFSGRRWREVVYPRVRAF